MVRYSKWWQFKNCMRLTRGICIQRTYRFNFLFFLNAAFVCRVCVLMCHCSGCDSYMILPRARCNGWMQIRTVIHSNTYVQVESDSIVSLLFTNVSFRCSVISIFMVAILYFVTFCGRQNQEKAMALFRHWCAYCSKLFHISIYLSSCIFMCTFNLATAGQFIQTNNDSRHDCAIAIWQP